MTVPTGPKRSLFVIGVPRSGTSVLHALICTASATSPYTGEASYLRMMLGVYPRALGLFDMHTRYVFDTRDTLQHFHADIMRQVENAYWIAVGRPDILVLKDPMMTLLAPVLREIMPKTQMVLMLRHPADVIASRLLVQDRLGVPRDPQRLIAEHNDMLGVVLDQWEAVKPTVLTYPMLSAPKLSEIKKRLGIADISSEKLWKKAVKKYPEDGQSAWMTPLYGAAPVLNKKGRDSLPQDLRQEIDRACLPLCLRILDRAKVRPSAYWAAASV
ncbi:sulfotransferase [Paracoccus jiaweipingae]|uniref:sulfotransferase n=1 Tax=unclassified Paracoccus (in: a-proteobacteria) TaxID=2688777 RepID=UPI0037AA792A